MSATLEENCEELESFHVDYLNELQQERMLRQSMAVFPVETLQLMIAFYKREISVIEFKLKYEPDIFSYFNGLSYHQIQNVRKLQFINYLQRTINLQQFYIQINQI